MTHALRADPVTAGAPDYDDPALEAHLEDLLADLPEEDLIELGALAEAMHADGGM